jgi:hypothetical protein
VLEPAHLPVLRRSCPARSVTHAAASTTLDVAGRARVLLSGVQVTGAGELLEQVTVDALAGGCAKGTAHLAGVVTVGLQRGFSGTGSGCHHRRGRIA